MSAPYSTLLLDLDNWDLCVDASGNIARADPPYAVAQDVSCAIRTFSGDCYYDLSIGIPYFAKFLGRTPNLSTFQQYIADAAKTVPTVRSATVPIDSTANRQITGRCDFVTTNGPQSVTL